MFNCEMYGVFDLLGIVLLMLIDLQFSEGVKFNEQMEKCYDFMCIIFLFIGVVVLVFIVVVVWFISLLIMCLFFDLCGVICCVQDFLNFMFCVDVCGCDEVFDMVCVFNMMLESQQVLFWYFVEIVRKFIIILDEMSVISNQVSYVVMFQGDQIDMVVMVVYQMSMVVQDVVWNVQVVVVSVELVNSEVYIGIGFVYVNFDVIQGLLVMVGEVGVVIDMLCNKIEEISIVLEVIQNIVQ